MAYLKASPAWYFRSQLNVYNSAILEKLRETITQTVLSNVYQYT